MLPPLLRGQLPTLLVFFLWLKSINADGVPDNQHHKLQQLQQQNCLNSSASALKCFKDLFDDVIPSEDATFSVDFFSKSAVFDGLQQLLNRSNFVFFIGDMTVTVNNDRNGTFNFQLNLANVTGTSSENALQERKMKKKMMDFLPFLVAPAFLMAGVMPWILPKLKMAVFLVGLINNIAFYQALYLLVRNVVFNPAKDEHVIYLNHGYKKTGEHAHGIPGPQHIS